MYISGQENHSFFGDRLDATPDTIDRGRTEVELNAIDAIADGDVFEGDGMETDGPQGNAMDANAINYGAFDLDGNAYDEHGLFDGDPFEANPSDGEASENISQGKTLRTQNSTRVYTRIY